MCREVPAIFIDSNRPCKKSAEELGAKSETALARRLKSDTSPLEG